MTYSVFTPTFSKSSLPVCTAVLLLCLTACSGGSGQAGPQPVTPTADEENKATVRLLRRFDTDRSGSITCADVSLNRQQLFDSIDKDTDGHLTVDEYRFAAFEDAAFQFYTAEDIDADESGTVELSEFSSVADNGFLRMDKDRDCTISRQEIIDSSQGFFRATRAAEERAKRGDAPPRDMNRSSDIKIEDIPPNR